MDPWNFHDELIRYRQLFCFLGHEDYYTPPNTRACHFIGYLIGFSFHGPTSCTPRKPPLHDSALHVPYLTTPAHIGVLDGLEAQLQKTIVHRPKRLYRECTLVFVGCGCWKRLYRTALMRTSEVILGHGRCVKTAIVRIPYAVLGSESTQF